MAHLHINRMLHTAALHAAGLILLACLACDYSPAVDRISFAKKIGQVEAGGPFVGVEFHGSRPLPSRISFYYPVANSIDLSTGYWERGQSTPLAFGLRIDQGEKIRLGAEGWEYTVSPHTVTFRNAAEGMQYSIRYEFCFTQPAMAVTYTIVNRTARSHRLDAFTQASMTLRTCQTFARKDRAVVSQAKEYDAVIARFNESDTDSASVFVMNAGQTSAGVNTDSSRLRVDDSGASAWFTDTTGGAGASLWSPAAAGGQGRPVCAFLYQKTVEPGDSLVIVQIIGSCRNKEAMEVLERLKRTWRRDVDAYDASVRQTVRNYSIVTGDTMLDRSVGWAAAMLASNKHYIGGAIVPMPCPAEYNFFFTHDVLLTDLGAVHFDRERVKKDLTYIVSLARDSVIPHAYYWRDDGMKTEFCPPDNWNHLWFILASAAYIRHTHDQSAMAMLFPFVEKSLEMILTQKKSDGLLYAKHPDWWDIGNVDGPRAYITALTARAIGEYSYLASMMGKGGTRLRALESAADTMKHALIGRLWDPQERYLINYNGADKDRHIYAGSLVAGAYGVLDKAMSLQLAETARRTIVDPLLGVRTVDPADFHLDSVIAYYHLAGKEAGEPYFYANGGVWPHTTAWYIWVLNAAGKKDDAAAFLKKTLSLDGIMASPNGQPAMFEYRYADQASPRYGEIDKPTFMWAAGFFLQSVYRIYGVNDNEWNISFGGLPRTSGAEVHYPFVFAGAHDGSAAGATARPRPVMTTTVTLRGEGAYLEGMRIGGRDVPSAVMPTDCADQDSIQIQYGRCLSPYLENINAIVHHAEAGKNTIAFIVSSFDGHHTRAHFVGPRAPKKILVEGRAIPMTQHRAPGGILIEAAYTASAGRQKLELIY